jgi:RNA polymerase-binding transcription factor DksA
MHSKTLKQLTSFRDELNGILENKSDKLLDSTNSLELQEEIERKVVNFLSETIEEIDIIIENIENGEYDDSSDDGYDY